MRLIDADTLNPMRCPRSIAEMREWIGKEPTIDAVEVVRCKDCKYVRNIESEWICEHLSGMVGLNVLVNDDDYCSYGERSEE